MYFRRKSKPLLCCAKLFQVNILNRENAMKLT